MISMLIVGINPKKKNNEKKASSIFQNHMTVKCTFHYHGLTTMTLKTFLKLREKMKTLSMFSFCPPYFKNVFILTSKKKVGGSTETNIFLLLT